MSQPATEKQRNYINALIEQRKAELPDHTHSIRYPRALAFWAAVELPADITVEQASLLIGLLKDAYCMNILSQAYEANESPITVERLMRADHWTQQAKRYIILKIFVEAMAVVTADRKAAIAAALD